MKVAVLRGGRSSEHEISLQSGASVARACATAGHEVIEVLIDRDGRWNADGDEVALSPAGGLLGADVVSRSCMARSARTAASRACSRCLDVPYAGPWVLAAAVRWTSSSANGCSPSGRAAGRVLRGR